MIFDLKSFFENINEDIPINVYIDGSCVSNYGGWGAVLLQGEKQYSFGGGSNNTDNNRMEMIAAIEALKVIPIKYSIIINSDSQTLINGMVINLIEWKKRKWKNSNNKTIKNKDLWELLYEKTKNRMVIWNWIKGHFKNEGNILADKIANQNIPRKNDHKNDIIEIRPLNSIVEKDLNFTSPLTFVNILEKISNTSTKKEGLKELILFSEKFANKPIKTIIKLIPKLEKDILDEQDLIIY